MIEQHQRLLVALSSWGVAFGLILVSCTTPALAESDRVEEFRSPLAPLFKGDSGGFLAQNPQLTKVTGVEVKQTPSGLQVILKTPPGQPKLVPLILPEGNNLLVEIIDATLAFGIRNGITKSNPAPGISQVKVAKIDATSVRVTITGATQQPPTAAIVSGGQNLVLNVTPKATAQTKPDEEIEIVVTGEREKDNYAVPNANVGTRTDAEIKDVPQSIQVIPRKVIEDQGADNLDDIVRNANGGGTRGFESSLFSDGVSRPNSFRYEVNLGNIEQVEVLDGPAAVLYGQGGPGGIVNVTTKQPLREPFYEIVGTLGNSDYYRGNIDLSGPLDDSKSALYRFNINYENSGSFIDFVDNQELALFPVLKVQLSEDTSLTLEGSYETRDSTTTDAVGLPEVGTIKPNPLGEVSTSRYLGEPDNETSVTAVNAGYLFEHQFSKDWSLRNRFRVTFIDYETSAIEVSLLEADNRTVSRSSFGNKNSEENYTLQTETLGKVRTGIVQHDLLLGLEFEQLNDDSLSSFGDAPPIDLFEPKYLSSSEFGRVLQGIEPAFGEKIRTNTIGLYAQDLLAIGKQVKILLGGRYDWSFEDFEDRLTNELSENDANAFSPRVGVVYQPVLPVSLYASWSRSFEPQGGADREGNPYIPITGDQLEVGVKTEFLDGKLATNLSVYQITRQNDLQPDPVAPDLFSVQIGEQRSQGVEFDVTGEPLPGLNLIAGYAYTDAIITEDTTGFEGNRLENVPQHNANFWAVYEIQRGNFKGFGFGTGLFYTGDSFSSVENTFVQDTPLLTNALLYYRRDNWRAQVNFENLFDVTYFDGSNYNAPFTIRGQLSAEF